MHSSHSVKPIRLYLIIALAVAGLILSVVLTQHHYDVRSGTAGFKSLCNISSTMNCDAVAASSYSEIFAGIPLSSVAAGWYLAILGVALFGLVADWKRESVRTLAVMSTISVLTTVCYLYIMASVLHTYCLYCLFLDCISVLTCIMAWSLKPEPPSAAPMNYAQWKTLGITTAACLFVSVVLLHGLDNSKARTSDISLMVQSVLAEPVLAVTDNSKFPSIGPAQAPITIEEFSDFECPYCKLGAMSLATVMNRYPNQVRVVFRNFPLDMSCNSHVQNPMHEFSCEAARTAYCAQQQGKFQPLYEELFEKQESLAKGKPLEFAKALGLDTAAIQTCTAAPQTNTAIQTDIEEGFRLGITSTPTFFINGRKVEGIQPIEAWNKIIDQLLASHG